MGGGVLSDYHPLDLIEIHLIVAAVVKLHRARAGVVAIAAAFSSVPPSLRYAVMPAEMARNRTS